MKINLLFIVFFTITFTSCKKDSPVEPVKQLIDTQSDSTYNDSENIAPQSKVLLMQEFTGVYCYTCPLAHDITYDIRQLYPNQVAAMNIHSHFFSIYDDPNVMGNLYDLRTADGDSIVSMLGGVLSVPSAAFNMKHLSGEDAITSNARDNWMGYASAELTGAPSVNIDIVTSFDNTSRKIKIVTKYHILQDLTEQLYYSIALVENEIIDKQFVGTVVVDEYHHQHILRDFITDPKANFLTNSPKKGDVYIKVMNYTVPTDWNVNNMEIITYVHEKGSNWNVKQTAIKALK